MAMLEGEEEISLSLLNKSTLAWVEREYHQKYHSELGCSPLERYINDVDVGRSCPNTAALQHAFTTRVHRRQRKSDGTFSLDGKRFEVPSQYRSLEILHIRYARWDLGSVKLVCPHTNTLLSMIYPQDKSENASGQRRTFINIGEQEPNEDLVSTGIAPLLKELMAEYAATGLPPSYLPKGEV